MPYDSRGFVTFEHIRSSDYFPGTVFMHSRNKGGFALYLVYQGRMNLRNVVHMPLDVYDGMGRPEFPTGQEYLDFMNKKKKI